MASLQKLRLKYQERLELSWEKLFLLKLSKPKRFLICTFIAGSGFLATSLLYHFTSLYFSSITIITVVIVALFSGPLLSVSYAVLLSILADYFFIPPIGGIFENRESFEHFFILCVISLFSAALISSLRMAYARTSMAKREAERVNALMEKMLVLVTHDIRNPLSSINLTAQTILRNPEQAEKIPQQMTRVLRTISRVDSMIQSLLDASRIRAGKAIPLVFRKCDLAEELKLIFDELNVTFPDRLKLQSESVQGNWAIEGLRRCIENLVSNAIKYGDSFSDIIVSIKKNNGFAVLGVHNEGPEISIEDQKNLFNIFQRAKSIEDRKIKGWGLGLAVVKGVVDAHGGNVEVKSISGQGTDFILRIPIQQDSSS